MSVEECQRTWLEWNQGTSRRCICVFGMGEAVRPLSFGEMLMCCESRRKYNRKQKERKKKIKEYKINMQMCLRHSCRLDMKSLMC